MKEIEQDQDKTDINLCTCLYNMIIKLDEGCVYDEEPIEKPNKDLIDYVGKLREYVMETNDNYKKIFDIEDFRLFFEVLYCRVALLTNEQIPTNNDTYYRVYRILYFDGILDANALRDKLDITIWSNGNHDTSRSKFLIYWKGEVVSEINCPPAMEHIHNVLSAIPELDDINVWNIGVHEKRYL